MTRQSPEAAQFFLTAPTPCPYLEGREERKLFTHVSGRRASALHQLLSEHGFRRSQNLVYRPACDGCNACRSVRVVAREFEPNRRFRRILRRNSDIVSQRVLPQVTGEQYDLFCQYLHARHDGGGMTQMSFTDFEFMVEDTPVETFLVEYRMGPDADEAGKLIGVALSDAMEDGHSMVYSFFDPGLDKRSLGNFMILDHIDRTVRDGLDYLYLGYWVEGSRKMAYKAEFQPMQVQTEHVGWRRMQTA